MCSARPRALDPEKETAFVRDAGSTGRASDAVRPEQAAQPSTSSLLVGLQQVHARSVFRFLPSAKSDACAATALFPGPGVPSGRRVVLRFCRLHLLSFMHEFLPNRHRCDVKCTGLIFLHQIRGSVRSLTLVETKQSRDKLFTAMAQGRFTIRPRAIGLSSRHLHTCAYRFYIYAQSADHYTYGHVANGDCCLSIGLHGQ